MDENNQIISDNIRLPLGFYPDKYYLDVFVDIYNLKYHINQEIDLTVKETGNNLLILNSIKKFYQIKHITFLGYDPIADNFINNFNEKQNINFSNFFYSDEIEEFSKNYINLYNKFIFSYEKNFLENLEKDKKNNLFQKFFLENILSSSDIQNFKKFISMDCNNFNTISLFENFSIQKIKEEGLYIKLPRSFIQGERIKIKFEIDGRIKCKEDKFLGFFLSILGPQSKDLNVGPEEFLKLWQNNFTTKNNYLKNSFFTVACEPVEFRSIFPCFDEPCFKSKFNIKINIEKKILDFNPQIKNNFKILSNGELLEINHLTKFNTEVLEYKFSESPMMSIYLLTWNLGYYDYLETISNNITIRAYTFLDRQGEASFALDLAQKAIDFYKNYFNIPYMFHKIDFVPVPNLNFRALECWGCIVFINYALLVSKFLEVKEKKNVARTIVHEISHMWFGNLVTMEWWDDIWLNEGFARLLEFECLTEIKPEFEINYKFIESFFSEVLIMDESPKTHPVRRYCTSSKEIGTIFDIIVYSKGASCLRMIYFFVGKENFRKIISKYLMNYKYKNANTKNLWDFFKENLNIDVECIMDEWLNKSGHPALYVNFTEDKKNLIINQFPFPRNMNDNIEDLVWKIPLFIKTQEKELIFLMEKKTLILNLEKDLNIDYEKIILGGNFVKINFDMKGFYRVFYENKENLEENKIYALQVIKKENIFIKSILFNQKNLSVLDIVGILNDYIVLGDFSTCLFILEKIKPIDNYIILSFANKIYSLYKEYFFKYFSFNNLLLDQNNLRFKEKEIIINEDILSNINFFLCKYKNVSVILDNVNNFFSSLIDFNSIKEELYRKIYVIDPLCYLDEKKDEFLELALYYHTNIGKNEELIKFIVENFEKNIFIIHKNFKFEIYNIVISNSFKIFKDFDIEIKLFDLILNEFIEEYFDLSIISKNKFLFSLFNFENSSDNLVRYFIMNIKDEKFYSEIYLKNINYFRSFPGNIKKFIDCYIKIITDEFIQKKNNFSGNLNFINFLRENNIFQNDLQDVFNQVHYDELGKNLNIHLFDCFKGFVDQEEYGYLYKLISEENKFKIPDNGKNKIFENLYSHSEDFFNIKSK